MVLPVVVTYSELPQDPTSQVLVEACSAALQADGCALDQAAESSARGASVEWAPDLVWAKVRVWHPGAPTAERQLTFVSADARDERLRAVGLVVGALSREAARSVPVAIPQVKASPTPVSVAGARPPNPDRMPWLTLSAAVASGPLWEDVPWGAGPRIEVGTRLIGPIGLHTAGSLLVALRATDPDVSFRSLELETGLDGLLASRWVAAALGPIAVIEASTASTDRLGGDTGSTMRVGLGGRLAVGVRPGRVWGVQMGASLQGYPQRPSLEVQGSPIATAAAWTARGWAGVEIRY